MSNTPRTDAAKVLRSAINGPPNSGADGGSEGFEFVVTVDFAKQLEREIIALSNYTESLKAALNGFLGNGEIEEEIKAAREVLNSDKKGSDFIIAHERKLWADGRIESLERENQQLRADLKQCAECLNTAVSIIKGEYGSNNWRLVDFKIALSLPSVQVALKEDK